MGIEIERKWLVELENIPFDLEKAERHHLIQSYVCFNPQIRLRNVDNGSRFVMTVKPGRSEKAVLSRPEFEAEITRESYEDLTRETVGKTLEKTRYIVPEPGDTGRKFEIDLFEGAYEGLCVVELEFASEEEAQSYPTPEWCTRDITYEPVFKNVVMAQA